MLISQYANEIQNTFAVLRAARSLQLRLPTQTGHPVYNRNIPLSVTTQMNLYVLSCITSPPGTIYSGN
jgi:hypothetical protein